MTAFDVDQQKNTRDAVTGAMQTWCSSTNAALRSQFAATDVMTTRWTLRFKDSAQVKGRLGDHWLPRPSQRR